MRKLMRLGEKEWIEKLLHNGDFGMLMSVQHELAVLSLMQSHEALESRIQELEAEVAGLQIEIIEGKIEHAARKEKRDETQRLARSPRE